MNNNIIDDVVYKNDDNDRIYYGVYTLHGIMGTSIAILRSFLAVAVVVLRTKKIQLISDTDPPV